MADDDDDKRDDDNGDDDEQEAPKPDLAGKAYLKLFATMLVALLLFAGLVRGCAACQSQDPLTGEKISEPAPPPPPPPGG